jgi:hypothetical protein
MARSSLTLRVRMSPPRFACRPPKREPLELARTGWSLPTGTLKDDLLTNNRHDKNARPLGNVIPKRTSDL